MTPLVCFLQNAWSPLYAGGTWPRHSWLRALARSRSGRRLTVMLDDLSVCENTTPIVGATAESVVPADPEHIREVLERRQPAVVVACGKQAEGVLVNMWGGPLLAVPHPAHRLVTDDLYREARRLLPGLDRRLALRQHRDGFVCEPAYGPLPLLLEGRAS